MIQCTIPPVPYERDGKSYISYIPDMNGPFNSFVFCHKILGNILFPIYLFSHRLDRFLETKAADKLARKHESLAWALRAWCHSNMQSFRCTADGRFIETSDSINDYQGNSPVTRVQFMEDGGWNMIRLNALVFDWDKLDLLKSFYHKGAYLSICRNDENSPTGYADIVTIPEINYDYPVVDQVQDLIDSLNEITLKLVRHYNVQRDSGV